MLEAEGIPPTASTASVGPGIRYVSKWAYAYSGLIGATDVETSLLHFFTSGKGIIKATVQFMYAAVSNDPFKYRVYLNNLIVAQYGVTMSGDYSQPESGPENDNILLIIPPLTEVKVTAENEGSSNARDQCAIMTGRVYDA